MPLLPVSLPRLLSTFQSSHSFLPLISPPFPLFTFCSFLFYYFFLFLMIFYLGGVFIFIISVKNNVLSKVILYPFPSEKKMKTAVFMNNTSKYICQSQSSKCIHWKVKIQLQKKICLKKSHSYQVDLIRKYVKGSYWVHVPMRYFLKMHQKYNAIKF